ncbi:hypothetical protein [Thermogemmatispora onikobensis]|uniref:hypothetical protein n=1 Tax=Thermogemmatispora onikobensis TaxID=732234 RepID=UPI0008531C6E|nr:hypothetical protein [Thermogemmatispora onikobensis]
MATVAGTVFEQTVIVANAFGEMVDYVEQALHESARRRLQRRLLACFARLDSGGAGQGSPSFP